MRALSLTQPWATLMALGYKHVETRGWRYLTRYRGRLAIHAARDFPPEAQNFCFDREVRDLLTKRGYFVARDALGFSHNLPLGKLVAVVDVVDSLWSEQVFARYPHLDTRTERLLGDYGDGRVMIVTENTRRIACPVAVKGALGIWAVPPDVAAAVELVGLSAAGTPRPADPGIPVVPVSGQLALRLTPSAAHPARPRPPRRDA